MKKNKKDKKEKKILITIFIIALIMDQIAKIIAIFSGNVIITNQVGENNGLSILMSVIVIIMLIRYISNDNSFIKLDTKVILTLAISGATGNIIDRIWNEQTILFINLTKSINLNLAYIYVIIAWVGLAIILTKNSMEMLKNRKNKKVIKNEYKENKNK